MLDQFHKHRKAIIAEKVRALVEAQFFAHHPKFRNTVSIIVHGSVAHDRYDAHSDVDLEVIAHDERDLPRLVDYVKLWKRERGHARLQIHVPTSLLSVRQRLEDWQYDAVLRTYAKALIIHDPRGAFAKMQRSFAWYPAPILREKMHWLYAEAVFLLAERYPVAVKRKDPFYPQVLTLEIVRYLMQALLMANKQFPAFDKHLFAEVRDLPALPAAIIRQIRTLLTEEPHSFDDLEACVALVEAYLVKRKALPILSREAWLALRPKQRVDIAMK